MSSPSAAAAAAAATTELITQRSFQQGWAQLTAAVVSQSTQLTCVSHKAPTRLIPLRSSLVRDRHGAQLVALSNYGGGMLQGDVCRAKIQVEESAKLALITQGANRIYKTNRIGTDDIGWSTAKTTMNAHVATNGLLVMAPDPTSVFRNSRYKQEVELKLQDETSSLIWLDCFSAGRISQGERWDMDVLSNRTQVFYEFGSAPILVDSVRLSSMQPILPSMNVFGSMILHGPKSVPVLEEAKRISRRLASESTSIRTLDPGGEDQGEELSNMIEQFGGRPVCGVSQISDSLSMVRIAADSPEDWYRVAHACLLPLQRDLGIRLYSDRIQASRSSNSRYSLPTVKKEEKSSTSLGRATETDKGSSSTNWVSAKLSCASYMLVDSGLPTGAFAHSSGIEVAAQFGYLKKEVDLRNFVLGCVHSAIQLQLPLVRQSYVSVRTAQEWRELDTRVHSLLVGTAPACQASLDQGQGLIRVATQMVDGNSLLDDIRSRIQDDENQACGHVSGLLGLVGRSLGLEWAEVCMVFKYCVVRDMLSAAVRLNVIGPGASVKLTLSLLEEMEVWDLDSLSLPGEEASSAPVWEALHPNHDSLLVRLFRT